MKSYQTMLKRTTPLPRRLRGFSLIEVMVAVIIIAVGMLGIAKMQALTLSTTESSGSRSLVAIQAASLAASMHANRDYWVSGPPPASFNINIVPSGAYASTITIDSPLNTTSNCATTSACTPLALAQYDVQQWATSMGQVVPASLTTVTCNTSTPVACTIQITWTENTVSTNNATAAVSSSSGALNSPQYTLYVEP